ncbi:hypothetical protein [Rhizorhabdus argentea]|uniref:hypothetical protein n=1 Tax=Rhizorhabdus argentea TaxID=1387174 RepID=UPI0030EBBDB7
MTAFSLGTVWEETIAFLRRESALLIPVGLAIFGPMQILLALAIASAPAMRTTAGAGSANAQMLLVLPAMILAIYGYLAVSLIVLVPGISVGEALLGALKRAPAALLAGLVVMSIWIVIAIGVVTAGTLGAISFGSNPASPAMSTMFSLLIIIPMLVIMVRMLVAAPVLAMEQLGTAEALRRIWSLGRDNALRFAGFWVLFIFLQIMVAVVDLLVIGSLVQLLKLAVSDGELLMVVRTLISAGLQAMLSLVMAVYIALIYRRIAMS